MTESYYQVRACSPHNVTLWRVFTDDFAQVAPAILPALEAYREATYAALQPYERAMWPISEFVYEVTEVSRHSNLHHDVPEGTVTFLETQAYPRISTFGT